jgi:hypothetical protein
MFKSVPQIVVWLSRRSRPWAPRSGFGALPGLSSLDPGLDEAPSGAWATHWRTSNPLPTAFFGSKTARKSAAGRVGRIVYKLLIYNRYPTLRGCCYEAKKCFFAADRGMRRGQPWPPGSAAIPPGAASAVRGSDGADSALRHCPGLVRPAGGPILRRFRSGDLYPCIQPALPAGPGRARPPIVTRLAQGILPTSCTAFAVSGEILTRCLGRRRAPSGSAPKANANRFSS